MLFPLHAFVELDESAPRNIVKSSISSAADFIGLCILDKSNSQQPQHCLEIYKLPRDAWLIEIEAVAAKYIDERLSASRLDLADESRGNVASAGTSGTSNTVDATTGEPVKGSADIHVHPRLHSASIQRQLSGQKFSVPVSNLKLQHLNTPSRMTWSSPYQASKVVGSDGDVIGVGINHLISSAHMTNRFAAFRSQHQQYLNYLLKDSQPSLSNPLPSFHFLPSGKISSRDTHPAGQTNMLAIWWSGDPYLMYYSLNKQTKGVNRPEIAWPVSCPVVCSAVTECGCSVALALANNSVIIWDRVLGLPCKAIRVNDPGQISWIRFVSSPSSEKCNGTKSGVTLLVLSTTGSIYTVTCTSDNDPIATLVSTEVLSEFEIPSAIEPIGGIPELILIVRRDGKIFLHDIYRKESLCEVALPPSSNTASDSEGFSVVALAASSGKMLYVKRTIAKTEDGNEDLSGDIHDDASLYVVKTWLFPHLDDYLKENSQSLQHHLPCPRRSSNRLEEHISNTMQKRIEDQQSRKSRLNARWFQMKEELSLKLHAESRAAK